MSDNSPTSDSKSQDLLYPTPKQHEDQQASTSNNPQSWPRLRKWPIVGLAAYCECLTFLVSMMLAPSVPQVLETFRPEGSGKALGSFCVTVYILGFIVGPLILAPLTDHYGRVGIYRLYIIAYLGWTVACARSNSLESLITFRFLAGCFGGAPMAIGRAVVADLYGPGERPGPMAFYSFGTIMGPTLGPVLGGIVNGNLGWRWVFWLAAILAAVAANRMSLTGINITMSEDS
ncbi:cycloheximide resistance protein [Colletotrichum paranaense]|uniref:Cycloheximide resistance protein n=1 Tax=Colletotrichum paranaense TaxID=1914294 RepID=A0ABQ9T4Q6_9PEZI|nr:cycloheximide resistance protein [Colletotrichum paranaense]KAK1546111.1 cycloheximide resistance protein [Colletotrichum paranaense]